jgi:hypothetical protein
VYPPGLHIVLRLEDLTLMSIVPGGILARQEPTHAQLYCGAMWLMREEELFLPRAFCLHYAIAALPPLANHLYLLIMSTCESRRR